MFDRLDVAGVMPPEPAAPACVDVLGHGPCPVGPVNAGKSSHHGVHDVREPVAALQCITAVARGARYLGQLAASLAMYRGQVIRVSWHLRRLRQPAGNFFSLFNIHVYLSFLYIATISHTQAQGSSILFSFFS